MLGMVFTEFLDMVDQKFPTEVADQLISLAEAQFASRGIYTSVGNYDHAEMLLLVKQLSDETGFPVSDLVEAYGEHLFDRFRIRYPSFFEGIHDSFEFLEQIEAHIHKEVRMLYPSANLPTFDCRRHGQNLLVMEYSSERPFAHLAYGLMKGCAAHYNELIEITMTLRPPADGRCAIFRLQKNEPADGN